MQILIVDLGSQYTTLIGRTLRELGVRSAIVTPENVEAWLREYQPKGMILSGGAASIYDLDAPKLAQSVLSEDIPVLGICLGMHWLAKQYGGEVASEPALRGFGAEEIEIVGNPTAIFSCVTRTRNVVWMSHGDSVTRLPAGFRRIAKGKNGAIAAMASEGNRVFGVQFHPEVNETECGREVLCGFLNLCMVESDWKPADVVKAIRNEVAETVPKPWKAVLAFSGGVDSTTLARIVAPVLGSRVLPLAINTGGLRAGEIEEIQQISRDAGCQAIIAPWADAFLKAVGEAGTDAEAKRLAFQETYRRALESEAQTFGATHLLQGTLAPDIIESGRKGKAELIKTHHNLLPETWLKPLHPFRDLFKYEVRDLARYLGLPPSITEREPFPGPGLYCRIVGIPVSAELLETVRLADREVRSILAASSYPRSFAQLVVALHGASTVGIKGDRRSYGLAAVIRAVETADFMTCRGHQFPPEIRRAIQHALTKHTLITRVWFDENDKPPATTELE